MTTPLDIGSAVDAVKPSVIALRRALHQHPELAFSETWTAATLAPRMRALALAVQNGIGGTGVLAMLDGARPGRTLLLRADIDGLPIRCLIHDIANLRTCCLRGRARILGISATSTQLLESWLFTVSRVRALVSLEAVFRPRSGTNGHKSFKRMYVRHVEYPGGVLRFGEVGPGLRRCP
jgi:hypothetical protein